MSIAASPFSKPYDDSHGGSASPSHARATTLAGLMVEFDNPDALHDAAKAVRNAGYTKWDVHTPFPVHGLEKSMGIRPTILPSIILIGGLTGCLTGLFLTHYTNGIELLRNAIVPTNLSGYPYPISGKPTFSTPAYIPVVFELTVLFSALTAVFGMLAMNGLPTFWNPLLRQPRFRAVTNDRFFLVVEARDPKFDATSTATMLRGLGGGEPERVEAPVESAEPPRWLISAGILATCFALIPLVVIAKARNAKMREPRIHIVQDMDNQERYKGQMPNPAFADGRAMRPEVDGTVARGDIRDTRADVHFTEGLVDGDWAANFPAKIAINEDLLERGQNRFNIYCSACHGLDGRGNGPVNARNMDGRPGWETWVQPTSMHDQSVRDRAHGHIFNTITNGIRTMPPYGASLAIEDRWAIVAYVRALQQSSAASLSDVPENIRKELEAR